MAREEAIEYFKFHRKMFCEDYLKACPKDSVAYQATLKEKEFYDMAIKSLELEPCCNCIMFKRYAKQMGFEMEQEPKSEWEHDHEILKAYSNGANEVLDKIRAEIQQIIGERNLDDYDFCSGLIVARKIIDKYKAESEVSE